MVIRVWTETVIPKLGFNVVFALAPALGSGLIVSKRDVWTYREPLPSIRDLDVVR